MERLTSSIQARVTRSERPWLLLLASGAVAVSVVFPLTRIVWRAASVEPAQAMEMLVRPATLEILVNSVVLTASVTLLSILLAVPLAVLTVRTDLPYRRFWTVVVALPLAIPSYIGAFAFVSVFRPRGLVQSWLEPFGVERLPDVFGLHGAILIITLYTYPYVYLTTRAALKAFDKSLVEAALVLDHGRWSTFRRVTLPQIRPAITAGALLTALYAVSDFGTPAFLQARVFTRQIYISYGTFGGLDYAAFLSLQLVAFTVVILLLESRIRGDEQLFTSGSGRGTDHRIELGRWRWPAMAWCASIGVLTLALPILIFFQWLARSQADVPPSLVFRPEFALNSVYVAGLAALVAVLAALPVAYLSARYRSRLGWLFERATYVGYAVPGIVIGLALVFFGARYGTISVGSLSLSIYMSIPILVFAYVVRFLPQAVGSTRTTLLQVNPQLTEAAYTLGRSPLATFRHVTLPLIAPGVVAGAALVFLTTMKELPATLLLKPAGFETLVTRIWAAESAGYYGQAAIPALILLVVSGLSMLVILAQEGYDVD